MAADVDPLIKLLIPHESRQTALTRVLGELEENAPKVPEPETLAALAFSLASCSSDTNNINGRRCCSVCCFISFFTTQKNSK